MIEQAVGESFVEPQSLGVQGASGAALESQPRSRLSSGVHSSATALTAMPFELDLVHRCADAGSGTTPDVVDTRASVTASSRAMPSDDIQGSVRRYVFSARLAVLEDDRTAPGSSRCCRTWTCARRNLSSISRAPQQPRRGRSEPLQALRASLPLAPPSFRNPTPVLAKASRAGAWPHRPVAHQVHADAGRPGSRRCARGVRATRASASETLDRGRAPRGDCTCTVPQGAFGNSLDDAAGRTPGSRPHEVIDGLLRRDRPAPGRRSRSKAASCAPRPARPSPTRNRRASARSGPVTGPRAGPPAARIRAVETRPHAPPDPIPETQARSRETRGFAESWCKVRLHWA